MLGFSSLFATHYSGGHLSYECLSPCSYRIYYGFYFDCSGGAFAQQIPFNPLNLPTNLIQPNILQVQALNPTCILPTTSGIQSVSAYQELTPLCPSAVSSCSGFNPPNVAPYTGMVYYELYQDFNFCNTSCTEFEFVISSCCRQNFITNLTNPSGEGIYYSMFLDVDSTNCNTGPVFQPSNEYIMCANQTSTFDLSLFDPDGDSLVYRLTDCLDMNNMPNQYNAGYSGLAPFGPGYQATLDSMTGILTLVPQAMAGAEAASLCMEVEEYRNGQLLSRTNMDLLIQLIDCGTQQWPQLDTLANLVGGILDPALMVIETVPNPLSFTLEFSDPNLSDALNLTVQPVQGSALPGGLSYTTSGSNPLTVQVSWTPDSSDVGNIYEIEFEVTDGHCPLPGREKVSITFLIGENPLGPLLTYPNCGDSTGAIDLNMLATLPGPFTYLWSTGDTTEDLQNLPSGLYSVTVTDSTGQTYQQSFALNAQDLLANGVVITPDCDSVNGSIQLNVSGGTAPYTFLWTNGDSTATISGLNQGGYSVDIVDSTGCFIREAFLVEEADSCENIVSGTVYLDVNGNCVQDSGEVGLPGVLVLDANGNGVVTDSAGYYEIATKDSSLQITLTPANIYACPCTGACTASFSWTGVGNVAAADFALDPAGPVDWQVQMGSSFFVPGFTGYITLAAINNSFQTLSGDLHFSYDSTLQWISSTVTPFTIDTVNHQLHWKIDSLGPQQIFYVSCAFQVPASLSIGDSLYFTSIIEPLVGDIAPQNNLDSLTVIVVGAYDPNDKLVKPAGFGQEGFIQQTDSLLRYTVRFQNTGNFPATFVEIRDTLSQFLDIQTLKAGPSSHPYTLRVEEGERLIFFFDNIQLPDSASDPAGSQGFVSFTIEQKPGLALGTMIENSASIYFDFNAPVITPPVVNTIYAPMEVLLLGGNVLCPGDSVTAFLSQFGLPPFTYAWSNGVTVVNSKNFQSQAFTQSGTYTVTVSDALGIATTDSIQVNVQQLPTANFFTQVVDDKTLSFNNLSQEATSYLWDFGDGSSSMDPSPTHTYAASGLYDITLTASNICGDDIKEFEYSIIISSLQEEFAKQWKAYPVPFRDSWTLERQEVAGQPVAVEVLDIHGRRVFFEADFSGQKLTIDTESWASGAYVLRLRSQDGSVSKRLWKR